MADSIQFETPENVKVVYQPAGLGTRFLAWAIDQLLVSLAMFVIMIVLMATGSSLAMFFDSIDFSSQETAQKAILYAVGVMTLVFGLGSFVYFTLSELLLRGQSYGKRIAKVRVVKSDGFGLDTSSIFLRNLFRVADNLPPLWVIPFLSSRCQRVGDIVAGTLVISDELSTLSPVRAALSENTAADAEFRFSATVLKRLRPQDVQAIEQLLERWPELNKDQQSRFLDLIVGPLVARLEVEAPPVTPADRRLSFMKDLLSAEYRRQNRALG